jgi:hypothetical protein
MRNANKYDKNMTINELANSYIFNISETKINRYA